MYELLVFVLENGMSGRFHQRKEVVNVMHRQARKRKYESSELTTGSLQMSPHRLFRCQVMDKCSGNAQATCFFRFAANTPTPGLDGKEAFRVAGVFQFKNTARGDGVAKSLIQLLACRRGYKASIHILPFLSAKRNQTCLHPARWQQPGLLGTPWKT